MSAVNNNLIDFGGNLGNAIDAVDLGIWQWDITDNTITYNPAFERLTGYRACDSKKKATPHADWIHENDASRIDALFQDCVSGKIERYDETFRVCRADGGVIWVREKGAVLSRGSDGRATVIIGILSDINKEQQIEGTQITGHEQEPHIDAPQFRETHAKKEEYIDELKDTLGKVVTDMEKARKMSDAMFGGNPHANMLFNDKFELIDCNPTAITYFGFATKDEFMRGFLEYIEKNTPEYQPSGQKSPRLKDILLRAAEEGYYELGIEILLNGRPTPQNVVFKRIQSGDSFLLVGYVVDVSSLKEAQNDLVRQDLLLHTINDVTSELMSAGPDDFDNAIWESMQKIGKVVDTDRMYIWENYEQNGTLYCRQTYEWSEGAEPQQGKDFTLSLSYDDVPYWKSVVFNNQTLNTPVKDLPWQEQSVLTPQGILSIMILPVFVQDKPWGFIGFDDCHALRRFTEWEEKTLHSGGNTLVSAILRNEMTVRLIEARNGLIRRDKLLRAVNSVASTLMGDDGSEFQNTLYDALGTLGRSIDVDHAYIWRNSMVEDRLYCSQVCEWSDGTPSIHAEAPKDIPYDKYVSDLEELLKMGNVNSLMENLPEGLKRFPGMKGVISLLIIPVFYQGEFWGFIGFDDCRKSRTFDKNQVDMMESSGLMIASAIMKNEMTVNLIAAREEALASVRSKSDFLSRMSHEIRTPMNAIIGMTTLARKTDKIERIQGYLDKVDSSSRQLLAIINDVLDMSKIDANKLEISETEFDFDKMMQNVIDVVQVRLDEKRQDLHVDFRTVFDKNMISDELRLSQVLINLLTNAIKFTPERGIVKLSVNQISESDDCTRLHFEVEDTGIGIPKDRLATLFQSFEQADGSITREFGGTGLGLAISQRIVNLMGGDIAVESEVGSGSCFMFDIDVKWGEKTKASNRHLPVGHLRILVVDDSRDVLDYFRTVLDSFSMKCDTVASGQAAVDAVTQAIRCGEPYDVVFVDWKMPEMDGCETSREIRRIMHDNIIVIMISVADWADISAEAESAGVNHFLPKPVLPSTLYDTIVRLTNLELHEENDEPIDITPEWNDKAILLVEDNNVNRVIVQSVLEDTGITIDEATDGEQAVQMFSTNPEKYDLVLMDVQMPVMDGLTATRKIRAECGKSGDAVPIIAMTANAFNEDKIACLDAGMNGHIAKPFELDELLEMLMAYLK